MAAQFKHGDITERIIGAAYEVYNTLGYGFLEKVYENAMMVELRLVGLKAEQQVPIVVVYKGEVVGEFVADIVVEDKVIVEMKAVSALDSIHEVQLVNYLKATGIEVGLLLNFGREMKIHRKVFDKPGNA
jgi:GxxExxY protein